jgi:hypothetical protein
VVRSFSTRRLFLSGMLGFGLLNCAGIAIARGAMADFWRPVLAVLPHDLQRAAVLGESCLQKIPESRCAVRLWAKLAGSAVRSGGGSSVKELRKLVSDRRTADFAHGDCVVIDGWVLTRTEARLLALAAIYLSQ